MKYPPLFVYDERSPPSRHVLLRFWCSWKPQDIIDFYTYLPSPSRTPEIYVRARLCACVCGWTSVFRLCTCTHLCVYVRQGRGVGCVSFTHRSWLGARRTTSPSAFPFQTDSTPAIKRKENFYMAQAPRVASTCARPS